MTDWKHSAEVARACGERDLAEAYEHLATLERELREAQAEIAERKKAGGVAGVLDEREKTHGAWDDTSHVAQSLKTATRRGPMRSSQREALDMICSKIARIVSGDPNEIDHWRDVAGYAELVVKDLQAQKNFASDVSKPDPGAVIRVPTSAL